MNHPEKFKTQTVRICPEIHASAKVHAAKKKATLQVWVENALKKEMK